MNQFSFFDAPLPVAANVKTESTSLHPERQPARARNDVLRIVTHKAGPFIELKDGKPSGREFRYVETIEHALFIEFTDGERRPAHPLAMMLIEDGVRNGMFVEVRA